jgi:HAD superfamily hydrolase (TIGR01509 family)
LHGFINDLKQKYTSELVHQHCRPCFSHEFALARLKAEGYRLAVASNSVRASIELMMERSGLASYLDLIVSNQDVAVGKPDPAIYQKAIAGLGLKSTEALVVEDNPNGIAAARAAGAHLMIVGAPNEVTYERIREHLTLAEASL